MPRGNPNVWKHHGTSYAELANTTTAFERAQDIAPRRLPPVGPSLVAELRSRKAAGVPAAMPLRGAGSFVLQTGWTLGVPGTGGAWTAPGTATSTSRCADGSGAAAGAGPCASASAARSGAGSGASASAPARSLSSTSASGAAPGAGSASASGVAGLPPRTYSTEARSNFAPPPSDFRRTRSAGPRASLMPKPDYPNDWRTSKQVDFRSDRCTEAAPPHQQQQQQQQPARQRDSGRLLPQDLPAAGAAHFTTQQRTHFPGRSQAEARAIPVSGCPRTQAAGYNIITGAVPYTNNAFEHWDGRDYRRHR